MTWLPQTIHVWSVKGRAVGASIMEGQPLDVAEAVMSVSASHGHDVTRVGAERVIGALDEVARVDYTVGVDMDGVTWLWEHSFFQAAIPWSTEIARPQS